MQGADVGRGAGVGGPLAAQKGLRCVESALTFIAGQHSGEQQHVACDPGDVSLCPQREVGSPGGPRVASVSGIPSPSEALSAPLPHPSAVPLPKRFPKVVSCGDGDGVVCRGDMDSGGPGPVPAGLPGRMVRRGPQGGGAPRSPHTPGQSSHGPSYR